MKKKTKSNPIHLYVKVDTSGDVRYAIAGTLEDGKFSCGIVYGYCGGGEYDDAPVFKGKIIPMSGELDNDEYYDMLDQKMKDDMFTTRCWSEIERYTERQEGGLVLNTAGKAALDKTGNGVYFFTREEFMPLTYSMTSFEDKEEVFSSIPEFLAA